MLEIALLEVYLYPVENFDLFVVHHNLLINLVKPGQYATHKQIHIQGDATAGARGAAQSGLRYRDRRPHVGWKRYRDVYWGFYYDRYMGRRGLYKR